MNILSEIVTPLNFLVFVLVTFAVGCVVANDYARKQSNKEK